MAGTTRADLERRLRPFLDRGLIDGVPTRWQLRVGSFEMAPYVVLPDAGDAERYDGAPLGHPLARTPLVLGQIGWEHFRIGHGLGASLGAVTRHCAYVYHEGMPVYDLQLIQTHHGGLDELRRQLSRIDSATDVRSRKDRAVSGWVIPHDHDYRARYLQPGGFIDRAAAFDYPEPADFLRPEFFSVATFCNYCVAELEPNSPTSRLARLAVLRHAAGARFREQGQRDAGISLRRLFGKRAS